MSRIVAGAVAAVLAAAVVVAPGAAAPAQAVSPAEVKFTADALPTWQTNGVVWALAEAQGTVFAGGTFSQVRPPSGGSGSALSVTNLATFDAATGNPTSCQPGATLGSGTTVRALAVSPDGETVYVGGLFGRIGSSYTTRVAAIDVDTCTVRSSFAPGAVSATVRALAVSSDGETLYLGGDFQSIGGQERIRFAALDAETGALLPWRADADGTGRAVAVSPDGSQVAIGGDFFAVNGTGSHSIAVVDGTSGSLVRAYPRGFIHDNSVTKTIIAGESAFFVGNEGTGGGVFDGRLAINYTDREQRWRDTCLGATQSLAEYEGLLYSGHHMHHCGSMNWFTEGLRIHLSAQRTSDAEMVGWYPDTNDGIGEGIGPRAMTVAQGPNQDYMWVAGEFTTVNGQAQQGLTRFGQAPDTGNPPPTTVSLETTEAGAINVRWRSVVDRDDTTLTYHVYRNGSSTPIASVPLTNHFWYRPQGSFIDTSVTPGQTYSYRVRVSDGANTGALSPTVSAVAPSSTNRYAATVLADDPTLYWRYDETSGDVGWDSSAAGRNAIYFRTPTLGGATGAIVGDPGTGIGFNGSDEYAYNDTTEVGPTTYTVETWFRTSTTRGGKLIGFGNGQPTRHPTPNYQASSSYDRHVYMRNDGRLVFGVWTGSAQTLISPTSLNNGQWHHVVASQGPGGMRLYVDGVQVGQNSVTAAQPYSGTWRVGGDQLNGWPSRPSSNFFAGELDETAVYPTVLSPTQVSAHRDAGIGVLPDDTEPPTAPEGLSANATDDDVALTWTASSDDVAVTGYQVHRSTSSGFIPSSGTRIATVTTTAYADTGLEPDTYYYRVVAVDEAGNASAPSAVSSATVELVDTEAPTAPSDVTATPAGAGADVSWSASSDDVGVTGYAVHRSTSEDFTPADATKVGDVTGTAFADTGLDPGTYYYRVVAVDGAGNASEPSEAASVTVQEAAPEPVEVTLNPQEDTWVNQSAPSAVQGTYNQLSARGGAPFQASYLKFDLPEAPAGTTLVGASLRVRTTTATSAGSVDDYILQWADSTWSETTMTYAQRPDLSGTTVGTWPGGSAPSETYEIPLLASQVTDGLGEVRTLALTSSSTDNVWLWSKEHGAASYRPLLTLFFEPAGAVLPDTQAPTAPGVVEATPSGTGVAVSWSAASDDRGVAGYVVHRGDAAGFTPSAATEVAEVTNRSYLDADLEPGTYHYRIVALDDAGNESDPSATASATVEEPPVEPVDPVVVTLSPAEDTWVNQYAATAVQGTYNQLSARGGPPFQASYLKFDLPAAPAGTVLTEATLRLRTTTASSAGSADPYTLQWAESSWSEATMAYADRPELSGTTVGTWAGGSAPGTTYEIALLEDVVAGRLNGARTLALTSDSTDNVWVWSKEQSNAAYRPQLTLTFEAP